MRALFLGTGGYHPNERRETAGLLLPEVGVLFDAGTGTYRLVDHLQTKHLSIFLTHAHLDHVVGLTYLLPPLMLKTIETLKVYGTPQTLEAVQTHLFAERLFPVALPCEFVPLHDGHSAENLKPPGVEVAPGVQVHFRHQPHHPGGSVGYRVDVAELPARSTENSKSSRKSTAVDCVRSSRRLAYLTDTACDPGSLAFVEGVQVLVHECYFPDERVEWADKTGHSHTTPVAELARDAGAGRLLLTHIDPLHATEECVELPVARRIFPNTDVAEDLMEFEV